MNHLHYRPLGKTRVRCRDCGCPVMERISNGRAFNTAAFLLFVLLTCGLGLFAFPVFTRPKYALHCRECDAIEDDR